MSLNFAPEPEERISALREGWIDLSFSDGVSKPKVTQLSKSRWRVDVGVLSLLVVIRSKDFPEGLVRINIPATELAAPATYGEAVSRAVQKARVRLAASLPARHSKSSADRIPRSSRRSSSGRSPSPARVPGARRSVRARQRG